MSDEKLEVGERAMLIAARYVAVGLLQFMLMVGIAGLLSMHIPKPPRDAAGEAAAGLAVILGAAISYLVVSLVAWSDLRGKESTHATS